MYYNYINTIPNVIEPKYICFCGCKLSYSSVRKHFKSQKHKLLVKSKLFDELLVQLNSSSHTS